MTGSNGRSEHHGHYDTSLQQWLSKSIEETYTDKLLEKELKQISSAAFKSKLSDSNAASKKIGNTYAASVFMGIASLVDKIGQDETSAIGKNAVVFSYGSGSMASMYRLHIRKPEQQQKFTIGKMSKVINFSERLSSRKELEAKELDEVMDCREKMHKAGVPYQPQYDVNTRLFPGTYYLKSINANWTRVYDRFTNN